MESVSQLETKGPTPDRATPLWSLRKAEAPVETDQRRWPANQKESSVLRKNLERAFEKAANKQLWFERLRQLGCSQDFYEFVLQRTDLPLAWIIDDLRAKIVEPSTPIRSHLRSRLSVVSDPQNDLSPAQLKEGLSYLTPSETQQVLLSRFVLTSIPEEVLNDNSLELFWDALEKIGAEVKALWTKAVLQYLKTKTAKKFSEREWRWVTLGWKLIPESLDQFPAEGTGFPWQEFLDQIETHARKDLLLSVIHKIPDERLKASIIEEQLTSVNSNDRRILLAIHSIHTEFVRHALLSIWFLNQKDFEKAIQEKEEQLLMSPIVNDQLRIARELIDIYKNPEVILARVPTVYLQRMTQFLDRNGGVDSGLCGDLVEIFESRQELEQAWKWALYSWVRANRSAKVELLDQVLDLSFRARIIDETQRMLVDYVFKEGKPDQLTLKILNVLLDEKSIFKVKHLRREFIEQAGQLFPLKPEVLKVRSQWDYRGLLLWNSFYGDDIDSPATIPSYRKKRSYELWELTESVSQTENYHSFAKYLSSHVVLPKQSEKHEFLSKAERILYTLGKQFGVKNSIKFILNKELTVPILLGFNPLSLQIQPKFFEILDEEMWASISIGVLQVLKDRERGLFEEKRLIERFFQGMLLSGAPISKLLRLWVWLSIHENLIEPTVLRLEAEALIEKLPFLNSLIIFYLSRDFAQKIEESAIIPN